MKKLKITFIAIITVAICTFAIYFFFIKGAMKLFDNTPTEEIVEKYYFNKDGYLHAYPAKLASQYLSESIGLYLAYLVETGDEARFKAEVNKLTEKFTVAKEDHLFIRWVIYEPTYANALIDDVRIMSALMDASKQFNQPEYDKLAAQLKMTLAETIVVDDYYVDFYDWQYDQASSHVVLSYLIPEFVELLPDTDKSSRLLKKLTELDGTFFPEKFNVLTESYVFADEVHLIDQLLIAMNRANLGESSLLFDEWLIKEWKTNGKVFGKYQRDTNAASVNYESLAVYYYLATYFNLIDQKPLAQEVIHRTEQVTKKMKPSDVHFFDFIHARKLLE